jgi:hypothetical protein
MATTPADRNAEAPVISTYDALMQDIILTFNSKDEYEELATRILDQFKHDEDSMRLIREVVDGWVDDIHTYEPTVTTKAYYNRQLLRNGKPLPLVNYITSQDWDTGND